MTIGVYYDVFNDPEEIKKVKYPSDYFNISEIEINGCSAFVSKEDNQFTDIYIDENNIEYSFFMQSLDYDECYKIVESMCK